MAAPDEAIPRDLSDSAAEEIDMIEDGKTKVKIEMVEAVKRMCLVKELEATVLQSRSQGRLSWEGSSEFAVAGGAKLTGIESL